MTPPDMENAAPGTSRSGAKSAVARKAKRVSYYHSGNGGASALDRPLEMTRFRDPHARSKRTVRKSLRDFAVIIPQRVAASKEALSLIKLGAFGDQTTRKGSLRHNANLRTIEGVEADYDGEVMSIAQAAAKLDDAGIAAVLYTSPSHRPDAPRWRVLCPTSEPLDPAERGRLTARVNGALGGVLASESFTLSQSYYYGRVDGRPAPRVELVDGVAIDLADHLDAGALDKRGKPYHANDDYRDDVNDDDLRPEPDVDRIRKALESIPADALEPYAAWLEIGQALHHEFGGDQEGLELWDAPSQWCDSYDRDEIEAKWDSFGRHSGRPVTIGTLYKLAKKYAPKSKRQNGGLRILTTEDCEAAAPRACLIENLLSPGDIASIFGAPGAGKSLLGPYLGYQVALGETAFGMNTKPGVVLYVAAEDPHGMAGRVRALSIRQGHAPNFLLAENVGNLLDDEGPDLESLMDVVRERKPSLIFIDTLVMAFSGLEENDAKSMGRVVAITKELAGNGAAVVLVHHDTKAEGSTPRGHSILNGALDMAMHVKRGEDGIVRAKLTKNRNGGTERDIAFRIGVEPLGENEFGNPITAAVVEEIPRGATQYRARLTAGESAALAKLITMEDEGRVTEDGWRAACIAEREVSGAEDMESRKRAMRRVVQGLAKKKLILTRGGFVASAEATSGDDECDDI